MTLLASPPRTVVHPGSGLPAFGTYRGAFHSTSLEALAPNPAARFVREKRWIYTALVKPPWLIAMAIVDLGYVQSGFAYAFHRDTGMSTSLASVIGVPVVSGLRQNGVHRIDARLRARSTRFDVRERRGESLLVVHAMSPTLEIRATLDLGAAPPAMTAVAPVPGGVVNVTEKRTLAPLHGAAFVRGERVDLEGGIGGYDLTHGLLGRATRWNWAFFMGADDAGEPIAMNLVQGFVGAPECALFGGDQQVVPLSEGRFEWNHTEPRAPWSVRTADGECDLRFQPRDLHAEAVDVGVVRSKFVQALGTFEGTVRRGSRTHRISNVLGITEDQDVRW